MRLACSLVLMIVFASAAAAQQPTRAAVPLNLHPSDVDVLLAAEAVLHTADMITTSYDLRLSPSAREANPLLATFTGKPVSMAALSGAINVLQAYTIAKLQHRHRKIALWWARSLVGVEVWATINNINAAGELHRCRAIGSRSADASAPILGAPTCQRAARAGFSARLEYDVDVREPARRTISVRGRRRYPRAAVRSGSRQPQRG